MRELTKQATAKIPAMNMFAPEYTLEVIHLVLIGYIILLFPYVGPFVQFPKFY